jgi:hypothetical protein
MEVYLVWTLKSDQYGTSDLNGVYASDTLANAVAERINRTGGYATVQPLPVLTEDLGKRASEIVKEANAAIAKHTRKQ